MNELEKLKQENDELRKKLQGIEYRRQQGMKKKVAAYKAKLDAGLAGATGPLWLETEDSVWKLIPEKVLTVQRIFSMAQRGLSAPVIAGYLRDTDVPVLGRAEEWLDSSVNALIQNVAVLGHMQGRGVEVARLDHYPKIIDEEIFDLVQKHVDQRAVGRGSNSEAVLNLFSGVLKCRCGGSMRYVGGGKRLPAFVICRNVSEKKGCDADKLQYQPLEDQLMTWICEEHQFDMSVNRQVSYDPARVFKEHLENQEETLQRMQVAKSSGALLSSDFDIRFAGLTEEIIELRTKIEALPLRFLKTGNEETKQLWDRHNAADGDMKVIYRLRLQASIKNIINEIQVSLYSKIHKDEEFRQLKLFGPVINLLYANRTEVDEADKDAATRKFNKDGITFDVKLPEKA